MALLLTESDVRILLDMPTAIEAVEESLLRQGNGNAWPLPQAAPGIAPSGRF